MTYPPRATPQDLADGHAAPFKDRDHAIRYARNLATVSRTRYRIALRQVGHYRRWLATPLPQESTP